MVRAMAATIRTINEMSQRRRCVASTNVEVARAWTAVELATAPLPYDEVHKDGCTEHAQNHRHWDLKRHDDRPADDIGQGDHHDAHHHNPGQVRSEVIASKHRDDIRYHQSEER